MFMDAVPRPAALLLLAGLLLAGCGASSAEKTNERRQTPEAGFVVLRAEPVSLVAELPGRTAAYEVSEVRPQVSG
jgi:membrane fusion protein (multidrug efflux system)